MGNEASCRVKFGKQVSQGKALLETSELAFRGDFRLKIPFASIKSVESAKGELRVRTADGLAVFSLGDAAEKWCRKILHPKTRIEKLGVAQGAQVSVIGEFTSDFLAELRTAGTASVKAGRSDAGETVFLSANAREELGRVTKLAKAMKGASALWIVYPKGQKAITENDVLAGGRKAGLKDVKVVGFSLTHTALKFVLPVGSR